MATYLELCQDLARESGTVSGTQPVTVTGQTGRLAKIVKWVATAWRDIQRSREDWLFLQAEIGSANLSPGTDAYTSASFGLAQWAAWIPDGPDYPPNLTLYDPDVGKADEAYIRYMDWVAFRPMFRVGVVDSSRPAYWSVSPAGEIVFGPSPDKAYVLNGRYRRRPQVLAADADTPICPEQFHDLIWEAALKRLSGHDEAGTSFQNAAYWNDQTYYDLVRAQTPKIRVGGHPLA